MKRTYAIALLVLAGIIGTGKALAQDEFRVKVPFDFAVGNKVLPAGMYSITPINGSAIEVQNRDTSDGAVSTTSWAGKESPKNVLVFDKYNGHYFLREILCDSANMNRSLPQSKSEKRALEQEAKYPTDGGRILLALK